MSTARRLTLRRRLLIRWRARRIEEPNTWYDYIRFHEIVAGNDWDLAANFDELNERYADPSGR